MGEKSLTKDDCTRNKMNYGITDTVKFSDSASDWKVRS